jgi:hypothetical protein
MLIFVKGRHLGSIEPLAGCRCSGDNVQKCGKKGASHQDETGNKMDSHRMISGHGTSVPRAAYSPSVSEEVPAGRGNNMSIYGLDSFSIKAFRFLVFLDAPLPKVNIFNLLRIYY